MGGGMGGRRIARRSVWWNDYRSLIKPTFALLERRAEVEASMKV